MQIVTIENLKPGMKLARTLYGSQGQVLLLDGVVLTWEYIERIKNHNFSVLYISDANDFPKEDIIEPIKEETKVKAINVVKSTFNTLTRDEAVNIDEIETVVAEMVDQILCNSHIIYNMIDIRSHDDYTFSHSVNVSILALLTGYSLKYSRKNLELLGTGALLHDIGKIFIPSAILNKPGKLEPDEYDVMKEHPGKGYQLLKQQNISYAAAHIAYEHHEREDGSGYPRSLTCDIIHHYAKIVAVADTFDAMTTNRVYRKAIPTHSVIRELKDCAGIKFSKPVVDCFIKIVAPYPLGSVLDLGNGDVATVITATGTECLVKIISGPGLGKTYDLYQNFDLSVITVLQD